MIWTFTISLIALACRLGSLADTVWGVGEVAKRPFRIEGDKAFGPGVSDEKGGLVLALYALQLAKEHTCPLCVEPGIPGDQVMSWRKGIGTQNMEVTGRNAHAGIEPEKGRNATLELAHQIVPRLYL